MKAKKGIGILSFAWPLLLGGLILLFWYLSQGENSSAGARLYSQHCANCHMEEGQGLRGLYPPLAGADYLKQAEENIACMLRYGYEGPMKVNGKTYNQPMPGNNTLSDQEITTLINYIRTQWGNDWKEVSYASVKTVLDSCEKQP